MQRVNFTTWLESHRELLNLPLRVLAFHISLVFAERISKDKTQRAIRTGALILHKARHIPHTQPTKAHYALFSQLYASLFERVFQAPSKAHKVRVCKEHPECFLVTRKSGEVFHSPAKEKRVRVYQIPYINGVRVEKLTPRNKVETRKVGSLRVSDKLTHTKETTLPIIALRRWSAFKGEGENLLHSGETEREIMLQEIAYLKQHSTITLKTKYSYIETESERRELGSVLRSIRTLFLRERESVGLHLVGSPLLQGKRTWKTLITERDLVNECSLVLWYLILASHPILQDKDKLTSYLVSVAYNVMRSYFSLVSIPRMNAQGEPLLNKEGEPLTKRVRRYQPMFYLSDIADVYQRDNGLFELVSMSDNRENGN